MDERLIDLEMRLTFQEETIQTLSESLFHQQRLTAELQRELDELRQRVVELAEQAILEQGQPDPPPPHY